MRVASEGLALTRGSASRADQEHVAEARVWSLDIFLVRFLIARRANRGQPRASALGCSVYALRAMQNVHALGSTHGTPMLRSAKFTISASPGWRTSR
jgi:hypothetical protein